MNRGSGFWRGPGLALGCLGGVLVIAGLAVVHVGPPRADGLVLMLAGAALLWARQGWGDVSYTKARIGYIWPRDPDRMKPNAELERGFGVWTATLLGAGLLIGGLVMAISAGQ